MLRFLLALLYFFNYAKEGGGLNPDGLNTAEPLAGAEVTHDPSGRI